VLFGSNEKLRKKRIFSGIIFLFFSYWKNCCLHPGSQLCFLKALNILPTLKEIPFKMILGGKGLHILLKILKESFYSSDFCLSFLSPKNPLNSAHIVLYP